MVCHPCGSNIHLRTSDSRHLVHREESFTGSGNLPSCTSFQGQEREAPNKYATSLSVMSLSSACVVCCAISYPHVVSNRHDSAATDIAAPREIANYFPEFSESTLKIVRWPYPASTFSRPSPECFCSIILASALLVSFEFLRLISSASVRIL